MELISIVMINRDPNSEKYNTAIQEVLKKTDTIDFDLIYFRGNSLQVGRSGMIIGAYAGIIIDV